MNPEIEEFGFLDEEPTKGEISFVPQILYVAREEISGLGYEETELGVTPGAGISVKS